MTSKLNIPSIFWPFNIYIHQDNAEQENRSTGGQALEMVKPWIFIVMTHNVVTWSEAAYICTNNNDTIIADSRTHSFEAAWFTKLNLVECRINSSNKFSRSWVTKALELFAALLFLLYIYIPSCPSGAWELCLFGWELHNKPNFLRLDSGCGPIVETCLPQQIKQIKNSY